LLKQAKDFQQNSRKGMLGLARAALLRKQQRIVSVSVSSQQRALQGLVVGVPKESLDGK